MSRVIRATRAYPLVTATLLIGLVGLGVLVAGHHDEARWLVSTFALVVAALRAAAMVRDVLHGTWGVDVLAVTAVVSTVVVGEYWAALVVVLMLAGGQGLENYASGRARSELAELLSRAPQSAHRIDASGELGDVGIDDVAVDDELLVKPGEVVPVDGVLRSAVATLDESSLTGESLPVEHVEGDALLSGALNGTAELRLRATATAAHSQYQQIVELVREAAGSKAPFVRLADRVAVPFTLVAFAIAGVAWATSGEAVRFAEVLVVATPCPLLIATPVAFLAGMSRAARGGIIVKSGGTLERLARIRTVAFDKTGTLTHGTPELVDVRPAGGIARDELLRLAASVEQHSGHALAASIVAAAVARDLDLEAAHDVVEEPGHGVSARVGSHDVVVGKAAFITAHLTTHPVDGLDGLDLEPGQIAVHVAVDGASAGVLTLADAVRAESRETLHELRRLGVRATVMLTGDGEETARHVADALGINEVRADCLPADKVAAVAALTDRPVLMVGDGVNDAPVLAAADVGMAMGAKGSTAASESADVVILLDDLRRVARAVAIGKRTIAVALQSIAIGVGLSVVLMVVAAFGVIPAIVGAGLQELVDLATILWALRATRAGALEEGERTASSGEASGEASDGRPSSGGQPGCADREGTERHDEEDAHPHEPREVGERREDVSVGRARAT